ncbi:uncharacterized protein LOC108677199 [Hyalella azteca]|uniref:Uncharacterized protein LOC108677199 n=1 Tax=Hyalella azteca TaxID=294128 RepID=A0A979FN62_HYAAZ|nr:uncharacterized protein LOC108677199 [Hyalella azteca]
MCGRQYHLSLAVLLCSAIVISAQEIQDSDFVVVADDAMPEETAGFVIPEYPPFMADPSTSQDPPDFDPSMEPKGSSDPSLSAKGSSDSSPSRGSGFQSMWSRNGSPDQSWNNVQSFGSASKLAGECYVSWVKRKGDEIRLLTWGLQTFGNDERYSLNFENPDNWKLQIKYTQRRDEGTYECQVSTHPPRVLVANLRIVAPVVEIIDERGANVGEKFYKTGSTIELRCTISQMPQAQTFILWRHGDHMLNYDTSRGGISVKTDMSSSVIVSTLYIANATPRDSGNYTCSLGDVATGGVLVHILNGEHPAAMQRNSKTRFLDTWYLLLMSLILSVASLISSDASHSTAQKAQPGAHLNALVNSSAIAR